jgi:hypothetical protein
VNQTEFWRIALGGGYSNATLQSFTDNAATEAGDDLTPVIADDLRTWNLGANFAFSGFSLGGSYSRSNTEQNNQLDAANNLSWAVDSLDVEQTTWVVGLGYDNGPWHLGTSYWTTNFERDASGSQVAGTDDGALAAIDADVHRYTVGAGYTFGPGMTFNGSIAWGEFDNSTGADVDAGANKVSSFAGAAATNNDFQQVTVGTNIQF